AFDANRVQNFLLELKIAAIKELDYEDYIAFLGLVDAEPAFRTGIYYRLKIHLSDEAARWFKRNMRKIRKGILYAGRWEQYFSFSAIPMKLWRGRKIRQLFSFNDPGKQKEFVNKRWNTRTWRFFLILSFNKFFFRWIFGDPGFYSQVKGFFSPGRYIHQRLHEYMENHLAVESFMLALIFKGKLFSSAHYPPYLMEKNFELLKERVHRVSIYTQTLDELLDSVHGSFCNKFSLSDVSSFLTTESYGSLFGRLAEKKDRRFCIRDFLTNRVVPPGCPETIRFFPELQDELALEDRSIGYTFIIGET
ncbi:MAG: DUF3419 family protein, partial [bacterium]|nr:DUF3419 family protein [bacterium]